jgi:lysophospholipase L1-like esterase
MPFLVFDGDSLTSGIGSTTGNDYPSQSVTLMANWLCTKQNFGVGGQTSTQMAADAAAQIDVLLPSGHTDNIVVCWGGINDLSSGDSAATVEGRVQTYCAGRRAAGYKVVVGTIIAAGSVTGAKETARQETNTWIRANWSNFADALADFANDSHFDALADCSNGTYYNVDTVHLTDTGYGIIAGLAHTAIDALLAYHSVPLGSLARTASGLLAYDDFSTDTIANYTSYTRAGKTAPTWAISGGYLSETTDNGGGWLLRNGITTAKCVTTRMKLPVYGNGPQICAAAKGVSYCPGYSFDARAGGGSQGITRWDSNAATGLVAANGYVSVGPYAVVRIYHDGTSIWAKGGLTTLGTISRTASDATYTSGTAGFHHNYIEPATADAYDWVDIRTSHLVICSGLPANYQIWVDDGTTEAKATAAAGTATVDTGQVLFPLAKIRIADANDAVATTITSATLTDMGGGDEFVFSNASNHGLSMMKCGQA